MKIGMGIHGHEQRARTVRTEQLEITKKKDHADSQTNEIKQIKSDEPPEKGVISKLQAGHFKGVADVRLRTIFQAELNLIQQQKESDLVTQSATELTATVSSEFKSFLSGSQLDDHQLAAANDALTQFEADVASVVADFADPQAASTALRSIVDTFLSSFGEQATTSVDDAVVGTGENAPIEGGDPIVAELLIQNVSEIEPDLNPVQATEAGVVYESTIESAGEVDPFNELLDKLRGIADEMLSKLDSSLMNSELPEPTRPNNNGRAFDKFLAIYRANSAGVSDVPGPNQVDDPTGIAATE